MRPRNHILTTVTAMLLMVGLAAGCSSDGPLITIGGGSTSTPAATVPDPTPIVVVVTATPLPDAPPSTPPPDPASTAAPTAIPTTPAAEDGFPAWLRVNGFGPADFGTDLAAARAAIAPRLGEPESTVNNPECGLTIAGWTDFSLAFDHDQFVGWFYTSSTPGLVSPSGVAPGISTDELRRVYEGVDISESTLGLEFFFEVPAGFMGGFFTADGGHVTEMYAGQNCFFR